MVASALIIKLIKSTTATLHFLVLIIGQHLSLPILNDIEQEYFEFPIKQGSPTACNCHGAQASQGGKNN